MKKKQFNISADMFNDKRLIGLIDFLSFISPAKTKDEKLIRAKDKKSVEEGRLGEPIVKNSANLNGALNRDAILSGTTLFGSVPKVTEKDIKLMADGGFDFLILGNGGEYAKQVMDWCEKYGIAVLGEQCREFVGGDFKRLNEVSVNQKDIRFHPASVGDLCSDEPNCRYFDELATYYADYNKLFDKRFFFINLFPAGAVKSQLGIKPYREYVDRYSKIVKSDFISADIYPFHPVKFINIFEMAICLETYHTIGNACRRDGKDFWLYIQTQSRWFSHLYTNTTYEMIKWQVYASLCYGCRSVIHASYNPVWGDDAIGMIDYNGNLTEQYLYAKKINGELTALSPVLKNYQSTGVKLSLSNKPNTHFMLAGLKQKHSNRLQQFSGDDTCRITCEATLLTGYFTNRENKKAIMLVDCKNIYNPYVTQQIAITWDKPYNVCVYEHGILTRQIKTSYITLKMGCCDGVFITYDD